MTRNEDSEILEALWMLSLTFFYIYIYIYKFDFYGVLICKFAGFEHPLSALMSRLVPFGILWCPKVTREDGWKL
jgi:hypothetical protein